MAASLSTAGILTLCSAVPLVLVPDHAFADTNWIGGTDDNQWNTANNWQPGRLPNVNDAVTINAGTPNLINPGTTIKSLAIGNVNSNGSLTVGPQANLRVNEDITLGKNAADATGASGLTVAGPNASVTARSLIASDTPGPDTITLSDGGTLTLQSLSASGSLNLIISGDTHAGVLNVPSIDFTRSANSSITFDGSAGTTFAPNVTTPSSVPLTQKGAGTTILTGAVDLTAVTITGGHLQLGDGRTSGSLSNLASVDTGNAANNGTLDFNRSDNITAPVVTGSGGIKQIGSGTTTIDKDMTYTGPTVISGGVLQLSQGASPGTLGRDSPVSIESGGTLTFDESTAAQYDGPISGSGTLVKKGTGIWTLGGTNTFTGTTSLNAGTLRIVGTSSLATSKAVNLAANTVLDLSGSNDHAIQNLSGATGSNLNIASGALDIKGDDPSIFSGVISGADGTSSIDKTGSGTLILSGQNTYSGGTTVSAGTLQLGDGSSSGSIVGNINVAQPATVAFNPGATANTVSGTISGTGSLTKLGSNTLVLTGDNNYTGTTTIAGGTLQLGDGSMTDTGTVAGDVIDNGQLSFDHRTALTFSGKISGTGSVSVQGAVTLTGINSYTGITTIQESADLVIGAANVDSSTTALTGPVVDNGQLTLASNVPISIAGVSGTGAIAVASGATAALIGQNTYSGGTRIVDGSTLIVGDGATNGSITGAIANRGTLVFNRSDDTVFDGAISGTGTLDKKGAGKLTLTAANNTAANTTVDAGVLQLGDASHTSALSGNVTDNATLSFMESADQAFDGIISGTGAVQQNGPGKVTLNGANRYTGMTDIVHGTLALSANGSIATSSLVKLGDDATLDLSAAGTAGHRINNLTGGTGSTVTLGATALTENSTGPSTFDGVIGGAGGLTKTGAGVLTLNGQNTFAGATTINQGTLSLGRNALGQSISVTLSDSAATLNIASGNATINNLAGVAGSHVTTDTGTALVEMANANSTFSGVVSGGGGLSKEGASTLTLAGANSYTGQTVIQQGKLALAQAGSIGNSSKLTLNGGALDISAADGGRTVQNLNGTGGTSVTLGANTLTVNATDTSTPASFGGNISGSGGLVKQGAGVLSLGAANDFTGSTRIDAGTLALTGAGAFEHSSAVQLAASGALDISGHGASATSINSLSGVSGARIILGDRSLTDTDNGANTFGGNISSDGAGNGAGAGGFTKAGNGALTLTGTSNYGGPTSVNGGSLIVNGTLNGSPVTVNNGASLSGTGTIGGATTIASGATLSGKEGTVLTLGSLVLSPTSNLNAALGAAGNTAGLFHVTGALTLTGKLNITDAGGFGVGVYRLFDYGGALTNNALAIGTTPPGVAAGDLSIQLVAQQVNVVNAAGQNLSFWDGAGPPNDHLVNGGAGTWNASSTNWTAMDGAINGTFKSPGLPIFQGTPGVVTVDDGARPISVTGMQFTVDGYSVVGGPLALSGPSAMFTVGSGAPEDANLSATIGSVLAGTSAVEKTQLGKLVFSGANTYTGATQITAGTLALAGAGSIAQSSGVAIAPGATFDVSAATSAPTIKDLRGEVGSTVNLGAQTLTAGTGNNTTFSGVLAGTGGLNKLGGGTLKLAGANTFTGATTIADGALALTGAGDLNRSASVSLTQSGALLDIASASANSDHIIHNLAGVAGSTVKLGNNVLTVASGASSAFAGAITGNGNLVKGGSGTLTLSGQNVYTGFTIVDDGTLALGKGGSIASSHALNLTREGATFDIANAGNQTIRDLDGVAGSTIELGSNTLSMSTDQLSKFAGAINGSGGLTKQGNGNLELSGANTYTGATALAGGTLTIDGSLAASAVSAASGTTLMGAGSITGPVTVQAGATLAGLHGRTLTTGALTLAPGSTTSVTMGAPDSTRLFHVTGDLSLAGKLDVTGDAGFGIGVYRLFDYDGSLSGPGLALGATPVGSALALQTAVANQVNLVNTAGQTVSFWDGGALANQNNGRVDGGAGTWDSASPAWTNQDGSVNGAMAPQPGFAVFQGPGGAITTDASQGALSVTGMQFAADGYRIGGDAITLSAPQSTIEVGDNSPAGAAFNAVLDAPLIGTGGLVKTDLGTLTLTGTNAYSGGTTISGGTLQLGDGGTSGSVVGDIADNANLVFNRSDDDTFEGAISGSGALTKLGANTLTLAGENSYGGGTTINAGTLQVGDGTTHGSITGNVANQGTLAFDRSDDLAFGGVVSGSGTLHKLGTGALTLSGENTYTGGTTVDAGMLQVGDGATHGSLAGAIVDNAALAFNRADDTSFDGAISGTGSLTKLGAGTLALSGTSSLSGPTSINAGRLSVNGSLANSALTVNRGATLAGNGTVGPTTVQDGGTVAPGNSIGTLNVAGDLVFQPGSTYQVETNGQGQSDLIHATGSAILAGGSLAVTNADRVYTPGATYTLISADQGVTGEFSDFSQDLPFIDLSVNYNPSSVTLGVTRNAVTFCSVAASGNQCATGNGVQSLGAGNEVYDALSNAPDMASARRALDRLSGEMHASEKTALFDDSRFVRDAVTARVRQAAADGDLAAAPANGVSQSTLGHGSAVWGQTFGSWGHNDGTSDAANLQRQIGGFFLGADTLVHQRFRVGGAVGYSNATSHVQGRDSQASSDNYHLALYGGTQFGPLDLSLGASYSWQFIGTSRSIVFPGLAQAANADYTAHTAQVFGEVGHKMTVGGVSLEPFANAAYVNLNTDGFGENGGSAALLGAGSHQSITYSTLGVHAAKAFSLNGKTKLTAGGTLGWRHAFGDVTPVSSFAFAGGQAFDVQGVPVAKDALVVEAGVHMDVGKNMTLGISYNGQIARKAWDQGFMGSFQAKF